MSAQTPLRLLVIGGSRFVGRYIVQSAVEQGHDVTVFNRGLTQPGTPAHVTHIIGDRRSGDLSRLARGRWDAVVDVCGYTAAEVSHTATVLRSHVEHYCFISTGAVYADMSRPINEDSPLVAPYTSAPTPEELISPYAELKVAWEQELRRLAGSSLSIVRLGVITGVGDYTGRLTYWVRRVADGGTVLGPPRAEQPLQLLHARDMAEGVLRIAAAGMSTCVNLTGPEITFADMLAACAAASGGDAEVVWGGPENLPLATPADGSQDGGYQVTSKTSIDAAAGQQPLAQTCRELLTWDAACGRPPLKYAGVDAATEKALIAKLKCQPKQPISVLETS